MCVSLYNAHFEGTIVYAGTGIHYTEGPVHVLGYQNTAQNLIPGARPDQEPDLPRRNGGPRQRQSVTSGLSTANAMWLHFPAIEPMGRQNIVDTQYNKGILDDMVSALQPPEKSLTLSTGTRTSPAAIVFNHDIYTIVMATDPMAIEAALSRVPADRRPDPNPVKSAYYAEKFQQPWWCHALCCFNNADAKRAAPMLWWYKPLFPALLYAPGLDCHDAGAPDENAKVTVDTMAIFGTPDLPDTCPTVRYSSSTRGILYGLLPKRVVGWKFSGQMANGDWVMEAVDAGDNDRSHVMRYRPSDWQYMMRQYYGVQTRY